MQGHRDSDYRRHDDATSQDIGGRRRIAAKAARTPPAWTSPDIELVVDDIVLTPRLIYCVGHYQREKKAPELWVVAREDGKVLGVVPVDGLPAFNGASAAGDKLFIATREGKLLCYRAKGG